MSAADKTKLDSIEPGASADCLDRQAVVTTYTDTTHFKSTDLIGFGNNFFMGWYVYAVWKADGSGGAPQGELQPVVAFTSADGTVQHTAFTVHLALTDKVLLIHPSVAYMLGLTPARAGYLDNINRQTSPLDFWSASQAIVTIPVEAADQSLPSVVIPASGSGGIPTSSTIVRVVAMFKFGQKDNTNVAANKLSGSQYIQIGTTNAIGFVTNQFSLGGLASGGGDVFIGAIDLSGTVTGAGTYTFKWASALASLASLTFDDIQMGLRVWFR
jgi:hypothetical protein